MIIRSVTLLLLTSVLLFMPSVTAMHYIPAAGDNFHYYETAVLNGGQGNYTGYTENTWLNGTEQINSTNATGNVSAYYEYGWKWVNNTGSMETSSSAGNFTFSSTNFKYINGTDNQTGYSSPYVWFYMNNTLPAGSTFYILNSQMKVLSTNYSYFLSTENRYVRTIYTEGNGSYLRNDVYGRFTATYNWKAYYDPATGYIIAYSYVEHDSDGAGNGFTYTENLYVTSTSYTLTGASPPSTPEGGGLPLSFYIGVGVVAAVIVILVSVLVSSRKKRKPLPSHPVHKPIELHPLEEKKPQAAPPPLNLKAEQPPVQQIVVKEVVKVKCQYCDSLIDSTAERCPFCGAPRT